MDHPDPLVWEVAVICDDKILLFEEHPDAYKAIEPVIAALEHHGQATRVAALTPIATVKL